MMKNVMKIVVCALTSMALAETLCAATYYYKWTGAAGDGLWTTPGNWTDENGDEPNQAYPQTSSTDVVLFDKTTPMEVTVDADVEVWSVGLKYGAGPLTFKGEHTLKLRSNGNGGYQTDTNRAICNENAGTLNTNGTITFECKVEQYTKSAMYMDAGSVFKGGLLFKGDDSNRSIVFRTPDTIEERGLCETRIAGKMDVNPSGNGAKITVCSNNVFHVVEGADIKIPHRLDIAGDAEVLVDGGWLDVDHLYRADSANPAGGGWVGKQWRSKLTINGGEVIYRNSTLQNKYFPLSNGTDRDKCPCDFKMTGGTLRGYNPDKQEGESGYWTGGYFETSGDGTIEITGGVIDFTGLTLQAAYNAETNAAFTMTGGSLKIFKVTAAATGKASWWMDGNFQLSGGEFHVRDTTIFSSQTFGISNIVESVTNEQVSIVTEGGEFVIGEALKDKVICGTITSKGFTLSDDNHTLSNLTLRSSGANVSSLPSFDFAGALTLDLRDYLDHTTPHTIEMNNANPLGDDAVILVKSGTTLIRSDASSNQLPATKLTNEAALYFPTRDCFSACDMDKVVLEKGSKVEVVTTYQKDITTATPMALKNLKKISGSGATLVVSKNGGSGLIKVPSTASQYITFSNCCVYASVFEQGERSLTFGPGVVVGAEGSLVKNKNKTGNPIVINQSVVFDSNNYSNPSDSDGATVDFSTTAFENPDASKKAIIFCRGKGEVKLPTTLDDSKFEVLKEDNKDGYLTLDGNTSYDAQLLGLGLRPGIKIKIETDKTRGREKTILTNTGWTEIPDDVSVVAADGRTKIECCLKDGNLIAKINKGFLILVR